MEKKKLIELLPRGFQTPEEHLDAGVFMTTEDDEVSSKLVKLYDRSLVIYSNAVRMEPWGRMNFDFDLVFEVIRTKEGEEDQLRKIGSLRGLKFQKGEEVCFIYTRNIDVIKKWKQILSAKLNQRGFHELFKPIKKIGKGNFASVYLAIRLQDQRKFAIKAFSKEATYAEDKGKESLVNEIQLMRKFNHKNLMRLYEVYESQNSIYVSVQLLEGGQLHDKIKAKQKFTIPEIQTCLRGLLMGLEHMHEKRIMHRDLKPQNILLRKSGDYDCVIADFGLSTWADEPQYLFVRCGTPGYVAPQIANLRDLKAKCDPICDMFSLGVIFHMLILGKSPFPGKYYNEVLAQNRACAFNFQTEEYRRLPPLSLDLMKRMLCPDPKFRIAARDALQHGFLMDRQILVLQPIYENTIPVLDYTNRSCFPGSQPFSPLMTTSNPFRKHAEPLKQDSCIKFVMRQAVMTGKTEEYESSIIDSPTLKKTISVANQPTYTQSRFGQERKNLSANRGLV